jgi:uncharacterized protein with FMN-binding domain
MRSSKHWSQLLQSSNSGNNKYTKKRPWVLSTIIMVAASTGGAFGINAIWLNPAIDTSGSASGATKTQTVKGDAIQYRYGVIEIEVTATNGKIESINEVQSSSSPDWQSAIPILHDAALKAQKADFGNLSGATFTTQAYQQALASALSKLN